MGFLFKDKVVKMSLRWYCHCRRWKSWTNAYSV